MINVIAKSTSPNVHLALRFFEEAKILGLANTVTYSSTITAIAKSDRLDHHLEAMAFSILDESIHRFNQPNMQHGNSIDLHKLSYGEVYFGLKQRLRTELQKSHSSKINLQLIYGRGLHCHPSLAEQPRPLKEAVMRVMHEFRTQGIFGQENLDNPGLFNLSIHPLVLRTHSLFPNRQTSNLHSNANELIPSFLGRG